jgi:hypothetical protein
MLLPCKPVWLGSWLVGLLPSYAVPYPAQGACEHANARNSFGGRVPSFKLARLQQRLLRIATYEKCDVLLLLKVESGRYHVYVL